MPGLEHQVQCQCGLSDPAADGQNVSDAQSAGGGWMVQWQWLEENLLRKRSERTQEPHQ